MNILSKVVVAVDTGLIMTIKLRATDTCDKRNNLTVIIKPTHACNLRCKYCYIPLGAEAGMMTYATLRKAMAQVVDVAGYRSISFIWHGGEPLLAGLDFFKEAASVSCELRKSGYSIRNSIQSNGTLVTDEFLDFIEKEKDFRLSFSLDGPEDINTVTRPMADGSVALNRVLDSISRIRIRRAQGAGFSIGGGVICVVSRYNIGRLLDVYDFFKTHRINIKINPLVVAGRATNDLAVTPEEYAQAMCTLFDRWIDDKDAIDVDPFYDVMRSLITNEPSGCHASYSCAETYVSIGPLGDIYPCGRFDGMAEYRLGHIDDRGGIRAALDSSIHAKMLTRRKELDRFCSGCSLEHVCNGGCPHNAVIHGDMMTPDPFCVMYKMLYGHIAGRMHQDLSGAEVRIKEVGANDDINSNGT